MTGIVIRIYHNKGFCFIRGEDGLSRFAHASDFEPPESFDLTGDSRRLEFKPTVSARGPKAIGIRLLPPVYDKEAQAT